MAAATDDSAPRTDTAPHLPVMADEVVEALAPRDHGIYVDGTFGAGGYARRILEAARCRVFGIDRDPDAIAAGAALVAAYEGRLTLEHGEFDRMEGLLARHDVGEVDGVALDLGVSSMQIDDPERGFSFRFDGPLDMRMSRSGPSAADVVNDEDEAHLADIIWSLGEERRARRVARRIVERRRRARITRTSELADVVREAVGRPRHPGAVDPATRTFQALRIHVNDELGQLDRGLEAAERLVRGGGRLAVVSFHSLEDRRVKRFLTRRAAGAPRGSRHLPEAITEPPRWRLLGRGAKTPSAAEIERNPRARSARLRAAERLETPATIVTSGGAS